MKNVILTRPGGTKTVSPRTSSQAKKHISYHENLHFSATVKEKARRPDIDAENTILEVCTETRRVGPENEKNSILETEEKFSFRPGTFPGREMSIM